MIFDNRTDAGGLSVEQPTPTNIHRVQLVWRGLLLAAAAAASSNPNGSSSQQQTEAAQ